MVTFSLKGPAKEWWNGVLTEVDAGMRPKVSCWTKMKEIMLKNYTPHSDVQEAYNQLMNLRQSGTV